MRFRKKFRARHGARKKSRANWLSLLNYSGVGPPLDRQTFAMPAPLASGTQSFVSVVLTSSGISGAVGGQIGKTKRLVGDVMVSALTTSGSANADLFVREALMYAEVDPAGGILVPDLFDAVWQGSEDILQHRSWYLGAVDSIGGVVRPNIHKQWFQDHQYSRWDTKVTRVLDESHILIYVVSIRPPGPVGFITMGGQIRGLVSK